MGLGIYIWVGGQFPNTEIALWTCYIIGSDKPVPFTNFVKQLDPHSFN